MPYDSNNIFAKILRGEIPCDRVFEDDNVLAFKDIRPKAPIHILVIPKSTYVSFQDFCDRAKPEEISTFFKTVTKIAQDLGLPQQGYRLISNCGADSGQEVEHFHVHLCSGKRLGPMA